MRQGIVSSALLIALAFGAAGAQQARKCVDRSGTVSFQDAPCADGYRQVKAWDAAPEPAGAGEPRADRVARKQAAAESRYLSRLAGTDRPPRGAKGHLIGLHAGGRRCEAAKRSRERALERAGLKRDFDLLSRLDGKVREACE